VPNEQGVTEDTAMRLTFSGF